MKFHIHYPTYGNEEPPKGLSESTHERLILLRENLENLVGVFSQLNRELKLRQRERSDDMTDFDKGQYGAAILQLVRMAFTLDLYAAAKLQIPDGELASYLREQENNRRPSSTPYSDELEAQLATKLLLQRYKQIRAMPNELRDNILEKTDALRDFCHLSLSSFENIRNASKGAGLKAFHLFFNQRKKALIDALHDVGYEPSTTLHSTVDNIRELIKSLELYSKMRVPLKEIPECTLTAEQLIPLITGIDPQIYGIPETPEHYDHCKRIEAEKIYDEEPVRNLLSMAEEAVRSTQVNHGIIPDILMEPTYIAAVKSRDLSF